MNRRSATTVVLFGLAGLGTAAAPLGCAPGRTLSPFRALDVPLDLPVLDSPIVPVAAPVPVPPVEPRRPQNILALSGGGAYGAYTAGVLNGWTRANTRPDFDVVTGISTGALIAPLAFLGSRYDGTLQRAYTEVRRKDVFAVRSIVTIPFQDAVASSAPLRRQVDNYLADDVVKEIAAEHRKGRRLYVATTQLDTRRNVVWDIGAIACKNERGSRKLIADVLVASASVPGVFPPVAIEVEANGETKTELHVDGGVTAAVFVPPAVFESAATLPKVGDLPSPPADLYAIVAGKYFPGQMAVRPRLIKVLKASGGALLSAYARRDLSNLYHMATLTGVRYHSVALRQDFPGDDAGLDFNQTVMTQLFTEGLKAGLAGPVWDVTPPDRGAGEANEIRTGVRGGKGP